MKVAIIGYGNVATVLGHVIYNAGHEIVQVIGRKDDQSKLLAEKLNARPGNITILPYEDADIYLAAVSDNALYHLDQYMHLEKKLVVHTAASVSKDVLENISDNYGVIYPLQSLSKEVKELYEIPLLIDGSSPETIDTIKTFASTISEKVTLADDNERLGYHIAAVFVNNFTNHLFSLAEDFCKKQNIDVRQLYPLIDATISRIKNNSPSSIQTGPAIREDIYTMGKHLQLLSEYPDLKYIYLKLSESILKYHNKTQTL